MNEFLNELIDRLSEIRADLDLAYSCCLRQQPRDAIAAAAITANAAMAIEQVIEQLTRARGPHMN
jgi:hypothetical protein